MIENQEFSPADFKEIFALNIGVKCFLYPFPGHRNTKLKS